MYLKSRNIIDIIGKILLHLALLSSENSKLITK